jgi:rare lipoprotein A
MGTISGEQLCRAARFAAVAGACLTLAQCGSGSKITNRLDPKYGVSASPRVVQSGEAVPRGGGTFRVGRPYTVAGRLYVPEEDRSYSAEGLASWYGDDFHGRQTANGEVFDMTSISAAHPTLPMPSYARVTNLRNGKSLIVRVNDRGPFHANRVMDVSYRAATLLEFERSGTARVRVEYVGRASLDGSDDRQLMATLRTGQPAPPPSAVMVASAKPFVPEIPSGTRGVVRGDVPLPEGRPYTLGHTSADVASINATTSMSASRRPQTVLANSTYPRAAADYQDAPLTRPVSAYAPARGDFTTGAVSGRGLY